MKTKKTPLFTYYNRNSKLAFSMFFVISIFVTISTLIAEQNQEYNYLFVLPLSYLLVILLFSNIFLKPSYRYGFLFYAAQVFIFIRFVITPYSIIITSSEYTPGPDPAAHDYNYAFFLMVYELVVIFSVIALTIHKNKRKNVNSVLFPGRYKILDNKLVIIVCLLFFLVILIQFPHAIFPKQLLFLDSEFEGNIKYHGSVEIISFIFKCTAFLFLISLVKKYVKFKKELPNVLVTLLILVVFLASVTSTSRWTLIFLGLTGLLMVEKLYPKYKNTVRISIISIIVMSVISISMYKFSWVITNSNNSIKDIIVYMTTQFQSYFSGPRPVAQSLNIKETFKNISVVTFTNDFIGSIPYFSNFIDQTDRINRYFNTYNYREFRHTLIMPLVGIGYTYFGAILSPVFSALSQWFIIKLDVLSSKEHRLEFIFVYIYLGLTFSMSMGLNTQSLFSSLLLPTIPLLLIFIINSRVLLFKK